LKIDKIQLGHLHMGLLAIENVCVILD
jgi:hypothetical protein